MSSQEAVPPLTDGNLSAELDVLSSLTVTLLNEHTNQAGLWGTVCGSAWPCESAVLADPNVATL
ncbi:MAG: hypothetical protein ACT4NY_28095 [Pseudonocardiales bacterium]